MKKQLALLSAAAILLISGCSNTESSIPTDITSEASTASESAQSPSESEQPAEIAEPLFRESSLYFDHAENAGAAENLLAAASAKTPHDAKDFYLVQRPSDGGENKIEYQLENVRTNAFVKFLSRDDISILIDPAYMYNIPLPSLDDVPADHYVFDINGNEIVCDSLFVKATSTLLNPVYSNDYCYASVYMDLYYTADSNGIEVLADLYDMDMLTNAETALNVCDLGEDAFDEKSADAAETYRALLSIKDKLLGEDIVGVNLIDLDFDGKPEVLVTRNVELTPTYTCTDVDIYSIQNAELVYIDTLYNNSTGLMQHKANVIGLKSLPDGGKAWFTMSRFRRDADHTGNEADYLFTLKDGKLLFTEVFSSDGKLENDVDNRRFYMNGEELQFGVKYDYHPYYDPNAEEWEGAKPDYPYYTYGDYTASFGKWEIYGWLRRDYCKDIEQTFSLYSSEFSAESENGYHDKLRVTERMIDYKLANLTDAFYFGHYDPTVQNFVYEFLGAYAKPVIYLYPTETTDVSVKVLLDGELTCTYPDYRDGWNVTASPDGTLIDNATGKEYYCLYWEGESAAEWDMSKGEVVSGKDTAAFLEEKLSEIGLSPRERNEFIIYWLPRMQDNEYNYITFQTEAYSAAVPLEVTPQPDSVLRVFMVYASVPEYFETQPQQFGGFERNGFTLVEWGGGEAVIAE